MSCPAPLAGEPGKLPPPVLVVITRVVWVDASWQADTHARLQALLVETRKQNKAQLEAVQDLRADYERRAVAAKAQQEATLRAACEEARQIRDHQEHGVEDDLRRELAEQARHVQALEEEIVDVEEKRDEALHEMGCRLEAVKASRAQQSAELKQQLSGALGARAFAEAELDNVKAELAELLGKPCAGVAPPAPPAAAAGAGRAGRDAGRKGRRRAAPAGEGLAPGCGQPPGGQGRRTGACGSECSEGLPPPKDPSDDDSEAGECAGLRRVCGRSAPELGSRCSHMVRFLFSSSFQ